MLLTRTVYFVFLCECVSFSLLPLLLLLLLLLFHRSRRNVAHVCMLWCARACVCADLISSTSLVFLSSTLAASRAPPCACCIVANDRLCVRVSILFQRALFRVKAPPPPSAQLRAFLVATFCVFKFVARCVCL
eukprot:EC814686.1.p2 GENE.EC814686.1~~EC814686.1.p2  ORF type:complete len:133 (-),score=8.36 EC814686.1:109-507(-)